MRSGQITGIIVAIVLLGGISINQGQAKHFNDRMAGWQYTLVATDEQVPNSCLSTYVTENVSCTNTHLLAKLVAGIQTGDKVVWTEQPEVISVEDFPGGVEAVYKIDGHQITTRIMPILRGHEIVERQGAALFEVKSDPPIALAVKCGESNEIFMAGRSPLLRTPAVGKEGDEASIQESVGILKSKNHSIITAVKATGELIQRSGDQGGSILEARFPQGEGALVLGYSNDTGKAMEFARIDPSEAAMEVTDHYKQLLQNRIETPEKVMNEAFKGALTTLEYNWIKPYGWIECMHHWVCMWHLQATGGLTWVGQGDRARESMLIHADNLFPNGAVPQFSPGGFWRRDFGGSDQFYAWQLAQYWNYTGDLEFAKHVAPALDRIIEHAFTENDPDGNGLLGWGQQIGNQEDYVATPNDGTTPTIEGIRMLQTRVELAKALNDQETVEKCEQRIALISQRLKSSLWQADLGRFLFYRDPLGVARLDGQYHTFIYPLIWSVVDPLDSWTSMRHLRERLTGENGEIYCSNNFPNHVGGTWGMQTGAAQQPWGAWGLSAMGLRNETYRPLKADAEWAMNSDHRGSWMEIAEEPTAAYFTPPAGLYIQSTIEALFGLQMHKPKETLRISPSFPDSWNTASVFLPDVTAMYSRQGNHLKYAVTTREALKRDIRWMLPPSTIQSVKVNGNTVQYETSPGVDCMALSFETAAQKECLIEITLNPADVAVECPGSIAEGDELLVKCKGAKVLSIQDRSRILSGGPVTSPSEIRGTISEGLLSPYAGFGRLGQMTFARRTLFALCETNEGIKFWKPIDLTLLPRYEAVIKGELEITGDAAQVTVLLRNNTSHALKGKSTFNISGEEFPIQISVGPRSEISQVISLPKRVLGLLSPGENDATLLLPSGALINLKVIASKLFSPETELRSFLDGRVFKVALPQDQLIPDDQWQQLRNYYAFGHGPWNGSKPPLAALEGKESVEVPGLPGISFDIVNRKMAPVSWKAGKPSFRIPLDGAVYSKFYLLVVPLLENHDTFSEVGKVSVEIANSAGHANQWGPGYIGRDLYFPGDLDWWCPQEVVGDFSTARKERPERFGLLPLLGSPDSDWAIAKPPAIPQPEFWSTSLPLKTASSVMNVIEVDLGAPKPVRSLTLSSVGIDPAYGLVAVTAIRPPDPDQAGKFSTLLPENPYVLPKVVFKLDKVGDLEGWKIEGEAFSVSIVFGQPTLNSAGRSGESATGKAVSPPFVLSQDFLDILLQGGNSQADTGEGALTLSLVEHMTGKILKRVHPNGTHVLSNCRIPVKEWKGKEAHIELEDSNTNASYAWIGISTVALSNR